MASSSRPNRIVLADAHPAHRVAAAAVLAMAEDVRVVAHCSGLDALYSAIASFPGSIVLFAASLQPDFSRLQILLESTGSRAIVLAEDGDSEARYLQMGFSGVVFRSDIGSNLVTSVHRVAAGEFWLPAQLMQPDLSHQYWGATMSRGRLSRTDMQLLSKVAVGLCMRLRTGVGEQMRPFGSACELMR